MTAADTDEALTEQLARALYYHDRPEERHRDGWDAEHPYEKGDYLTRAAAVLPIIAAEVRAAQADALREAKGRVYASAWWADGDDNLADRVRGFLSQCATDIEKEN